MDWYPHAPLTAFQVCRRSLFLYDMPFGERSVLTHLYKYLMFYLFGKTSNRRGTQFHAEKLSIDAELSSRPYW